tara:strand:+ start:75 stop:1721 length:1647 start_codon:yes stop_codon:yes gene_type:complete
MKVDRNLETSKQMLGFAWGLEILLCLSGIVSAFTFAYLNQVGDSNEPLTMHMKIAFMTMALPMIAIALSELVKIPLTKGLVRIKSYFGKCVSILGLLLVCWLTFDQVIVTQENIINMGQKPVNDAKREVNSLKDKIKLKDEEQVALISLTPEEIRKNAYDGVKNQLQEINSQIDDLEKSKDRLSKSMNPAEIAELKRQITSYESSIETLEENRRLQLQDLNDELKQINFNEQNELENVTFGKNRIKEHYAKLRNDIKIDKNNLNETFKNEKAKINKKITTLNNKVTKLSIPSESVAYDLSVINQQLSEANQNRLAIRQKVDEQIDKEIAVWEKKSIQIDILKLEKAELGEELNKYREILESGSSDSFLHRMAGIFYGVDNLADLSEDQVGVFEQVFMISIALGVSIIGPILSYLALKLQKESEEPKRKSVRQALRKMLIDLRRKLRKSKEVKKKKVTHSIRKALVDLRKRLRSPKIIKEVLEVEKEVEVIKEVPVERVVYQEVIKPEPVEIPVIIQVPVPTDPKDLPRMEDLKKSDIKPIATLGGLNQ